MFKVVAPDSWEDVPREEKERFEQKLERLKSRTSEMHVPSSSFEWIVKQDEGSTVLEAQSEDDQIEAVCWGLSVKAVVDHLEGSEDELPFHNIFSRSDFYLLFKEEVPDRSLHFRRPRKLPESFTGQTSESRVSKLHWRR